MKNIYLFDIDGTLADNSHRLHYMKRSEIDWEEFEKGCVNDIPIEATCTLATALYHCKFQVWLWTGRSENVRKETEEWLRKHGISYHQLLMRPKDEVDSNNAMLKERWLQTVVPGDRVICAFEDVGSVVTMLRENGILVLQVKQPEGD